MSNDRSQVKKNLTSLEMTTWNFISSHIAQCVLKAKSEYFKSGYTSKIKYHHLSVSVLVQPSNPNRMHAVLPYCTSSVTTQQRESLCSVYHANCKYSIADAATFTGIERKWEFQTVPVSLRHCNALCNRRRSCQTCSLLAITAKKLQRSK